MAPQPISVLHVEDCSVTRVVVRGLLQKLPDCHFTIRVAESEQDALARFRECRPDLVILDYQLTEGNGLSCLRQLRRLDPIVPILAVSGAATPQVAAELLEGGADDFINKQHLNFAVLEPSVRAALHRASVWRARGRSQDKQAQLRATGSRLLAVLNEDLTRRGLALLNDLSAAFRSAGVTQGQIKGLADWVDSEALPDTDGRKALLQQVCEFLQAYGPATTR